MWCKWPPPPPPARFVWYLCQCWQTDGRMWCECRGTGRGPAPPPSPVSRPGTSPVGTGSSVSRPWPTRPPRQCWWNGQLRVSRSRHIPTTTDRISPGEITQWRRGRWAAALDSLEELDNHLLGTWHCLCDCSAQQLKQQLSLAEYTSSSHCEVPTALT